MTKSRLIASISAKNPHLTQREIAHIIETIFDAMADALAHGERIELRGFGAFTLRSRLGRLGRNPRTGEIVHVPPKAAPYFRSSKDLLNRINTAVSEAGRKRRPTLDALPPPAT